MKVAGEEVFKVSPADERIEYEVDASLFPTIDEAKIVEGIEACAWLLVSRSFSTSTLFDDRRAWEYI